MGILSFLRRFGNVSSAAAKDDEAFRRRRLLEIDRRRRQQRKLKSLEQQRSSLPRLARSSNSAAAGIGLINLHEILGIPKQKRRRH